MRDPLANPEAREFLEQERRWRRFVSTIDLARDPTGQHPTVEGEPQDMVPLNINGTEPVLISIPHSGQYAPEAVAGNVHWRHPKKSVLAEGAVGISDLYTEQIYDIGDQPYTQLSTKVSRMLLDVGRPPMTDQEMESYAGHRGMGGGSPFWRTLLDGSPNFAVALNDAEQRRLIDEYHHRYHQIIQENLTRMIQEHGFALLLDMHSMPGVVEADHIAAPDYQAGQRIVRKPFDILSNDYKSAPREVIDAFQRCLIERLERTPYDQFGYGPEDVSVGFPFTGKSYTIAHHSVSSPNVWAFGLEVAKSVYMKNEGQLEPDQERISLLNALIHECVQATLEEAQRVYQHDKERKLA